MAAPLPDVSLPENASNPVDSNSTETGSEIGVAKELRSSAQASRYELIEEIAHGGMGVVYRATDTVLGREVAVKVLSHQFGPGSGGVRRFVDEARIAGQLQHPNIPAIHDLGAFPDGRPFLAMRLIKGSTLDELLTNRGPGSPNFIAVFEQICQAVGYAHAHNVVHRDLKPSNVMVGAFGEVQVMDWGLAKVLPVPGNKAQTIGLDESTVARTDIQSMRAADEATQAGSVLGTPAYMPPEQAIGAVDQIDERSDVFGLGAILCAILTSKPPYVGADSESTRQLAARARLEDAFVRLDACGAEPELVALCKRCLSVEKTDRLSNAGELARSVAGLRAAADERARQAELDRVRAEGERAKALADAIAQRRRRRMQLAWGATAGLLLLVGGSAVWWRADQIRTERERLGRNATAVAALLEQSDQALRANDRDRAAVALEAAQKRSAEGGADDLGHRLARLQTDLTTLRELDDIDTFRATWIGRRYPEPREIAARLQVAFAQFGIVPGENPIGDAARQIADSAIRDRLVVALDWWLLAERSADVLAVLQSVDPDGFRDPLRDAVQKRDGAKVKELIDKAEALEQPARFAAVLGANGTIPTPRRRQVLRAALRRDPGDLGLLMTLGRSYPFNRREGAEERTRWFQAAVGVAPKNVAAHLNLGNALYDQKDVFGAIAEYREAIRLDPKLAIARSNLGLALYHTRNIDEAIAAYREAIRLDPKLASAHSNLGLALNAKKDVTGAMAEYRQAIRLNPKYAMVHFNLGVALDGQNDMDGAIREYKEAIRLDPQHTDAFNNLAIDLYSKHDLDGAIAAYRESIHINPNVAHTHNNLGVALKAKKNLKGAIAEYREAIRLDPKYSDAHDNLGVALALAGDSDGAIAEFREVIRIVPKDAVAHNHLGVALADKKDVEGAIVAFREAIRLNPKYPPARTHLGNALKDKGDYDGAIVEYREAIRLAPKYAPLTTASA